jgi:ribonuclease HI
VNSWSFHNQNFREYKLKFGNTEIQRVSSHKFLGLTIDEKLTWTQHITNLINSCNKALNIINATCHKWWGADPACARNLYQALIRSRLEYGGFLVASANKQQWIRLERMQARALRQILKVFPSSPIPALQAEAGMPPLKFRCMHLSNKYMLKKMAVQNNPLLTKLNLLLQHFQTPTPYWNRHNVILPVLSWGELAQYRDKIRRDDYYPCFQHNIDIISLKPKITHTPVNKHDQPPTSLIRQEVFKIFELIAPIDEFIYTDGSKTADSVGCATVNITTNERKGFKLPTECSIFIAEATAISVALRQAQTSESKKFAICTDSKSVLLALSGNISKAATSWILIDIKYRLYNLEKVGKRINFLWIPSHCNIVGNEEADKEAKKAADEGETLPLPIPYTDLHPLLHKKQVANWRTHWDETWETIRNKTSLRGPLVTPWYRKVVQQFPLNPFLPWYCKQYYTREYITIITRLRIGHGNYPDHLHIINLKEDNLCECGSEGTLDHIFLTATYTKKQLPSSTLPLKS